MQNNKINITEQLLLGKYPIAIHEIFFKHLLNSLHPIKSHSKNSSIDKSIFFSYFKYPLVLSLQIFHIISNTIKESEDNGAYSILALLFSDEDRKSQCSLISSILSFDNQKIIYRQDIILLFSYLDYEHLEELTEIIKDALPSDKISTSELEKNAFESNSDIFWLFIIYLNFLAPFNREDLDYFSIKIKQGHKEYNKRKSGKMMIGKTIKLKQFLKKRFDQECLLSGLSINDDNNYFSESSDDEEDNSNNKEAQYHININDNENNEQRDCNDNDNDDELNDLNFFEEEISNVLSEYDSVKYSQIYIKKTDNNNKKTNSYLSLEPKPEQRNSTSQLEPIGILPGSINETIKTNFVYEKKPLFQLSTFHKSNTENKNIPKEKNNNLINKNNYYYCKYTNHLHSMNDLKNCRLIFTSKNMIIESEKTIKPQTKHQIEESGANNSTMDSNHCYVYDKIFPLKLINAKDKGIMLKQKHVNTYVVKIDSYQNDNLDRYIFYFSDKNKANAVINKINTLSKDTRDIKNDYNFIEEIGKGNNSTGVFLAKNKITKEIVAIKKVSKYNQKQLDPDIDWESDVVFHLIQAKHRNILKFIDIYESSSSMYYISEYINGISFTEYMMSKKYHHTIKCKMGLLKELGTGIDFLHSRSIIHRDIKPDNILIDITDERNIKLKIIDFGFARVLSKTQTATESFGTLAYIAPEILNKLPYSFPVDLWSFGVIVYQSIFGILPFGEETINIKDIAKQIINQDYYFPMKFMNGKTVVTNENNKELYNHIIMIIEKYLKSNVMSRAKTAFKFFNDNN